MLYSKYLKSNSCVLTGVCYDDDILKPVYDFLKLPGKETNFKDLINSVENSILKCFEDVEEWVNSDKFISEQIEANEYEFTEDGKTFYI